VSDDYLWDGTGEPDGKVQHLETLLKRFRHRGEPMELPALAYERRPRKMRWALWVPSLVAAMAIISIVAVVRAPHRHAAPVGISEPGWAVERLAGAPQLGSKVLAETNEAATLAVGQTLETDGRSRASISISATGEIQVDPDSRVRLVASTSARKRLALDRGTIHAMIWAPPGEFVVETPSAVAVDLGCSYTLHVDASGAGLLQTTFGWVGFKLAGRESLVPAGAVCAIRPRIGPGTPYFSDASEPFRVALAKLDFDPGTADQQRAELAVVLSQARKRDALTLWHLLTRVHPSERGRVYDRLALLVPPPRHVARSGVLRLDREMLDLWWNELNFGDMSLWRTWENSWPEDRDGASAR
jgi:FecR protein